MSGPGTMVGHEEDVDGARFEPRVLSAAVQDRSQSGPLGVSTQHHPDRALAPGTPAQVEDGRALVGVGHSR